MPYVVEIEFRGTTTERLGVSEAHRSYWKRMAERGVLLGGGPWREGSGELLVCDVPDRGTLLRILYSDPYAQAQMISDLRVREWDAVLGHVLLAALERVPAGPGPLGVVHRERRTPRGRAGAGTASDQEELTAHELRIASMMLDGMTNKQIAEGFSVSTRAVELHITRIYRKLDIRRRAQLAAALGQSGPARLSDAS